MTKTLHQRHNDKKKEGENFKNLYLRLKSENDMKFQRNVIPKFSSLLDLILRFIYEGVV